MVNLKKIATGVIFFFIGFLVIIIMSHVMPILITAGESIYSSTEIQQVAWLGAIIAWIFLGLVMPNVYIIQGAKESENEGIACIITGIMLAIFTLLITLRGYYMINTFIALSTEPLIRAIFWVGLISIWIEMQVIIPAYLIIRGNNS